MTNTQVSKPRAHVHVRNIGGIDETDVTLSPGISILTGRNATNRTSFLQALMTGLGSTRSSLKADADEGSVTIEFNGDTYTRTLSRENGRVTFSGDPYLEDPAVADLFAFLLENNEARRAVARGENLRDVIMRPIDTDRIEADIAACRRERDDLESKIERLETIEQELPDLEAKRKNKRDELASAKEQLKAVRAQLAELDTGAEESRTRKQELEEAFQDVRDARAELEQFEFDLETEQSTLAQLKNERDELSEALADTDTPDGSPDELAQQIDHLRQRKESLDETISQLGSIIEFNKEMTEGAGVTIDSVGSDATDTDDPTAALVAEDAITCWTCGSDVQSTQIESTLEQLRDLRADKLADRNDIQAEIDDLTSRQSQIQATLREREQMQRRLSTVKSDIESTQDRIDNLASQITEKESEVAALEQTAESIDTADHDEALELHREANTLELRIDRITETLSSLDTEITERETALTERESLMAKRDELSDRLVELRTRVDQIEATAVESFNDHMETVLALLEYENLERIWIERRDKQVRDGRRKVAQTVFELHIVRQTADGTAYQDTSDHLSESEREVTGLVFALAGYLAHEVHKEVPFILLDSLEAIDSDRIARVIEYFEEYTDYLIAALLPADADPLSADHTLIEGLE